MTGAFDDLIPQASTPNAFADLIPSDEPGWTDEAGKVAKAVGDSVVGGFERTGKNLWTGYKSGTSGFWRLSGNALNLVNRMSDYLAEKTGVGPKAKDTMWGEAEAWMRRQAEAIAPGADEIDDHVIAKIYQGLGAAPVALAEYGAGAAVAGPVAGFAAVDALRESDKGMKEAFVAGLKGAGLGKIFKAAEPLTRTAKAGTLATAGGAAAVGEGGDTSDVVAGAATMGILGAAGSGGRVSAREAAGDVIRQFDRPKRPDTVVEPIRPEPPKDIETPKPTEPEGPKPVEPEPTKPEAPIEGMKPSPRQHGETGSLPNRVPRTDSALNKLLDNADRSRFAPTATKAHREAAQRIQLQTLAEVDRLAAGPFKKDGGPETVPLILRTARGRETKFELVNDPEVFESLRKRLAGPKNEGKFYSKQPGMTERSAPGASYVGFVSDRVDGTAPAKPLRREDVLRPLMKAFDVPLYQGRIKGKKTLGFFRRPVEEVRVKKVSDIETTAHEVAHLLDYRVPEIRKQWAPSKNSNAKIRDELRGISYDQTKLYEGFAEFVRLWSTQKNQAQAKAPEFFKWFEDFVNRSEYGPALREAQGRMHQWFEQDAVNRARSKIGAAKEINAGLTSVFDRFRQSVADDLHGIYRMERDMTGVISPLGPYETARLTRAKHSMVEGSLLYGAPKVNADGSHGFVGKGLAKILDPVAGKLDDFLMYAVGRSARELMGQGRERLFTPAEIKGMLSLETPEFRKAFDEYQEWNRTVLDFAQAKGVINGAARSAWRRADYLPFHRVGQPGSFSPVPGDWKGIKALTGGTDNLRDVLGNMIGNAAMLMDAALSNEARLSVTRLAGLRGGAKFMARIPTEERLVKVHRAEVERQILDALGVRDKRNLPIEAQQLVDQIMDGMEVMVPFVQRGQAPLGGNVVAVLKNGKPEYYEVADPLLFRSLTHLNRPAKNWLVKLLSVPKRIGQSSITLAFDFMAANIARDTLMGAVMSRHGFKPIIDSARGMISRITTDPAYKEFVANGGGFASYLVDEGAFRTHLERFYTGKGIDYRTVLDSPSKLLFGVERIADAFEMSTRLGEYRKARERGEHPRHAAYSAREVSTDFAMRGDSATLGFLYDTVIFLKAGVNGVDRLYRGLAHDPNRTAIAAKTALIAALSAGLYGMNRDNPLYQDLEDWDRDTHWHFFIPTEEALKAWARGEDIPPEDAYTHLRYPKIWEIGAVASIAERGFEGFLDDQPTETAGHIARIIRDVFRFEYIPQAVAPLAEQAMNRLRFLDRPIETAAMQDMQPWARSGPFTSPTVRAAGEATRTLPEAFQVSPARLEALLRGYLNTWAMYGLTLSDSAFFDDRPDMPVDRYPVIRRFYEKHPARNTKHVTELYDAIEEATRVRRTLRFMDRTFRPQIADEMEHDPKNAEFGQMSFADTHLRAIRREIEQVMRAPSLTHVRDMAQQRGMLPSRKGLVAQAKRSGAWNDLGALKRLMMDDLVKERNEFAKRVMNDVRARRNEMGAAR